ncbi:hypothetical protein Gotur_008931 [Gossypium turneri]
MILKRRSEKLQTKAKAMLMKEQEMTMAIIMRGVQADDTGGGIGMIIRIHILDGRRVFSGPTVAFMFGTALFYPSSGITDHMKEALFSYLFSNFELSPLSLLAKSSQALFVEYGLWSWALEEASDRYNTKIVDLEKAMKTGENSMTELRRDHEESVSLIARLDARVMALKGKYKET